MTCRYYVAVAHSMVQAAARAHPGVPFRYVTAREAVQAIAGAADTTPPALAIRAAAAAPTASPPASRWAATGLTSRAATARGA